jgi:hypothetical protein
VIGPRAKGTARNVEGPVRGLAQDQLNLDAMSTFSRLTDLSSHLLYKQRHFRSQNQPPFA